MGFDGDELNVLLIERKHEPFMGKWAFPGGFLDMNETVEECARRELKEETGIDNLFMEQLHVYSSVGRDPRGRTVTVAFLALATMNDIIPVAGDDASGARWFRINDVPLLAFDHDEMLKLAVNRLRERMQNFRAGFEMLGKRFTMSQLHTLYESVLGEKLDRRNFSSRMMRSGLLVKTDEKARDVPYRAPVFYKLLIDFTNSPPNPSLIL